MKLKLQHVHYMPKELEPGVLYVSEEFCTAAHLCACGCGSKIRTPLGPTEWSFKETSSGPTLRPSVGNWQLPCRSHYWISRGEIKWSYQWDSEEIAEGRYEENKRRKAYYEKPGHQREGFLRRLWQKLKSLLTH
ncbi:MAG: DUF6527 family protein [Desulfobulbaceae bacterium]|nr:DUF6527 family protein [Desulfobulbaceae bacterium]